MRSRGGMVAVLTLAVLVWAVAGCGGGGHRARTVASRAEAPSTGDSPSHVLPLPATYQQTCPRQQSYCGDWCTQEPSVRNSPLPASMRSSVRSAVRSTERGVVPFIRYNRAWWSVKTLWFSRPGYTGPVHIRGKRLDGDGEVGFGEAPELAALVLPPGLVEANQANGYREWPGGTFVHSAGCYGLQIDGRVQPHDHLPRNFLTQLGCGALEWSGEALSGHAGMRRPAWNSCLV
jgi:hypothetical protein